MAEREIVIKLRKYIEDLKKSGISVNKAYLYGSYAEGTMNSDSDIDLLIVSDDKMDPDTKASIAWKLTGKTDSRIEPYLVSLKKFEEDEISPIILSVKRFGIEITN
ncbi:MAG TPA: nucleotidyltransferase domain-containing protein [Ignavibacteria bacterium]|nr:nucleotidyltransferase domain-containing protein [Ignavibacteria bacterium]HMQ98605.1 nucleotidyltransferase domain-containing protein [Ignavibacteria bacterium]